MKSSRKSVSFCIVFTLANVLPAIAVHAQQLLAWPAGQVNIMRLLMPGQPIRPLPPQPIQMPMPRPLPNIPAGTTPVSLSRYQVDGNIQDQAAELTYRITFHNPSNMRLEGVLIVPLPADTALSGFSMTVGGKKMRAELLESGQAATIYENIARQMRDPALLELVGERLFRARVFPIEPNSDIEVQLTASSVLHKSADLISLSVPLKSAAMTSNGARQGTIKLSLSTTNPLRTIYSPTPAVSIIRHGDNKAEISYSASASEEGQNLSLFYSMQQDPLAAGLLSFKEAGEDGYFLLSLSPKPPLDEKSVTPKDVVFIVDRSGSMEENGKIEQARKALSYCLKRLSSQDRFGIVDFATDTNSFAEHLASATPENKALGLRYIERIEAAGGTNIEAGLADGLKLLRHEPGRLPLVFFLTDGLPTVGQTDISALLKSVAEKNSRSQARLFTFGLGSDVNTLLLDKLAETNRGAHDYVAPEENIENKVSSLYQKVAKPALTDVHIEWKGVQATQVYPRPVTDIFYGAELTLLGRHIGQGRGSLIVTGRAAGRPARFEFPIEFPQEAARNTFLPRLWASLKVSHELDSIRLSGKADPEVVSEIVRLAKRYGIVTPYTSYLITEEGQTLQTANNAQARLMRGMAFDAASSGFSGGAALAKSAQMASVMFAGSGAGAPQQAERKTRQELKELGAATTQTRTIAGKTFYRRQNQWVDGEFELTTDVHRLPQVRIAYLSPEYFALLKSHPELGRYLALGSELTVVYQGNIYQIASQRP